jgi:alpha-galactosidase
LLNREIIVINQDPHGKQARRIRDDGDTEVFAKPLVDDSWAVGLLNRNDTAIVSVRVSWQELGIEGKWMIRDIWEHQDLGVYSGFFEKPVLPHQCVVIRLRKSP